MTPLAEILGESPKITALREAISRMLSRLAGAAVPSPVLILGETGVGKGLLARAIHRAGPRAAGPFVDLNCAAIPETLLESELFGFERGAFTDARQAKPGLIQTANRGTLFLDEIGALPGPLQGKLLKVLEERVVRRLGSTRAEPVDVWVLAATNADLLGAVQARHFREDLYHRLAVLTFRIPPLRERGEDVVCLARHFLAVACAEAGTAPKGLTPEACGALQAYAWPGNVRELDNVMRRAALLSAAEQVTARELGLPGITRRAARPLPRNAATAAPSGSGEAERFLAVLQRPGWSLSQAAAALGIPRNTLRYRMEKLGLRPGAAPATQDEAARIARALLETGQSASRVAFRLRPNRGSVRHGIDEQGLSPERPAAPPPPLPTTSPLPAAATPPAGPAAVTAPVLSGANLVGRERELREIEHSLAANRMVTLAGPAGVGKTRLALAVASRLRDSYPDGVFFVELASVGDGALVAPTVTAALGLAEEATRAPLEVLTATLTPRRALLILDDCEHLIEASAAVVGRLVGACPSLRVLVTSRERLDITGERTIRVPPLSVPDRGERTVDALMRSEAVRLFVERARLAEADFRLTDDNAAAVGELCRRLDGLPLALELAAARVALLSVEQIVERLGDRFRLLTGGGRTAAARQRTLQAALDWSHDLLTHPEQILLRRLSVFAGGFTIEAVEAVCPGPDLERDRVLDLLGQLVDKSLVVVEPAPHMARYRFLETIWEYARARAIAADEVAWLRGRHQAWAVALAEDAQSRGWTEQAAWFDRIEAEYPNVQAALGWRGLYGEGELSRLRLAAALWPFWLVRGRFREGREVLESILAECGPEVPGSMKADARQGAGVLARYLGDYGRAEAHHTKALAMRRERGDARRIPASLHHLGVLAHDRARYEAAVAYFAEAIASCDPAVDRETLAASLHEMGRSQRFQGQYDRADALGRKSLGLLQQIDHAWGIVRALTSLANTAHFRGDLAAARPLYEETMRLGRRLGDRQGLGVTLGGLALVCGAMGEPGAAEALAADSLAIRREIADRRGIGGSLHILGRLARWREDLDRAAQFARESLTARLPLEDRLGITCCLELLADVAAARGQHARAVRLLGAAVAERAAIGAPVPPLEEEHHQRLLATLRDRVGASAVETACREIEPARVAAEECSPTGPAGATSPRAEADTRQPGLVPAPVRRPASNS